MKKLYILGYLRLVKNNVLNLLGKRKFWAKIKKEEGVYKINIGSELFWIAYPNRIGFYFQGIQNRLIHLGKSFGINEIIILNKTDIVVDVGSNIGEFSNYAAQYAKKVYSFEPDPYVKGALIKNTQKRENIVNNYLALSYKNGYIKFFLKGETADSSLIDNGSKNIIEVNTIRFEDYFNKVIKESIKLLKCDAEGAEPEVIQGLGNSARFIEYIAIDCGPERGMNKEKTDDTVRSLLISKNFEEIDYMNHRGILLFKNRKWDSYII